MLNKANLSVVAYGLISALIITACGGGGGGTVVPPVAQTTITGTAATGMPIAGRVVAIDKNGQTFQATTNALGAYTVNVAGGTAPFILTIIGTSGGKTVNLSSVATAAGQTVNITPLTDLIVSTAAGQPGGAALVNLCTSAVPADQASCNAALTAATSGTKLNDAVTAVKDMIKDLNTGSVDPLHGSFTANGSGFDAVLDSILVSPATGQGAMATVTLISVPGVQLGRVTMPATPGGAATPTTIAPSAGNIALATNATTVLAEIRECAASWSALYPSNMVTPPTASQVTPFIDATFTFGGPGSLGNQAGMITSMSTLPPNGMARPGNKLIVSGLSPYDFSAQASAVASTSPAISANPAVIGTSAWVQMDMASMGGTLAHMRFIKNAAYAGCPGGWKMAGWNHANVHMQGRVSKWNFGNTGPSYSRQLPFHVGTDAAVAEGIGSIVVTGPGLHVYDPAAATGVGAATPITLTTPPVPTPPAVREASMVITNASQGMLEAIESCQDMKQGVTQQGTLVAGMPCYDETAVAPGAIFTWTVYDTAATPAVKYVFPYQIGAVPLSIAFASANDADLFAQNISMTPNGVAALTNAVAGIAAGAPMDDIIALHYTQSAAYGARTDHCGIALSDGTGTTVLSAEMNAVGQQTSCTFNSAGLNSGSLNKPAVAMTGPSRHIRVSNTVLGNMAVSAQGIPN